MPTSGSKFGRLILASILPLAFAASALAAPKVEKLWPEGAPGANGQTEKDQPTINVYLAEGDQATGAAVMVCPGGGYGGLAKDHEGVQVAQWLNSFGVSAFVLHYRVSPYRHPIPLGDAQRGLRWIRSQADAFKVDPNRIGVLGFSAGGHLASSLGTHFDAGNSEAADPIDRVSCRPDFLVLVYPVISFTTPYTHVGSRNNLLGKDHDPALATLMSNELQVTKDTPPTFLMHTGGDKGVPCENSILFYTALRKANVPAEMHIYEQGAHGFGLAPKDPVLSTWPARCQAWFGVRGFLKSEPAKP